MPAVCKWLNAYFRERYVCLCLIAEALRRRCNWFVGSIIVLIVNIQFSFQHRKKLISVPPLMRKLLALGTNWRILWWEIEMELIILMLEQWLFSTNYKAASVTLQFTVRSNAMHLLNQVNVLSTSICVFLLLLMMACCYNSPSCFLLRVPGLSSPQNFS